MTLITQTPRLIIREIVPTDADAMLELHSDPEVHRYIGNQTISTKEKIIDVINFLQQQYRDFNAGRWAIIDRKTNAFMGWTGVEYVTKEINRHKNYYDLGYRLMKKYWGQGIATESAIASLDYAFDKLNVTEIYAMADCDNAGSNKILEKVGLRFIETFDHDGVKHNWFKVDRGDYRKSHTH